MYNIFQNCLFIPSLVLRCDILHVVFKCHCWQKSINCRPRSQGDNVLGSFRLSIHPADTLTAESCLTYYLDIWYVGWPWPLLGWDCRSRSNAKNCVLTSLLPRFKVKGRGQGQGQKSRSQVKVNFLARSDIRGHHQSKVFVCVSLISGCMRDCGKWEQFREKLGLWLCLASFWATLKCLFKKMTVSYIPWELRIS